MFRFEARSLKGVFLRNVSPTLSGLLRDTTSNLRLQGGIYMFVVSDAVSIRLDTFAKLKKKMGVTVCDKDVASEGFVGAGAGQ